MTKVVTVAEIVRRRIFGLHQLSTISSTHIVDTYEPTEAGLKTVTIEKHIPTIDIVLAFDVLSLSAVAGVADATAAAGYQQPLPQSAIVEQDDEIVKRDRGNGGRGNNSRSNSGGAARGGGRGGRGGRGGGRGGSDDAASTGATAAAAAAVSSEVPRGGSGGRGGRGGGRGRGSPPA